MEDNTQTVDTTTTIAEAVKNVGEVESKTLTQEQVDKIIADRLTRQEKSIQEKYEKKLKDIEESERLKNMSESERMHAELESTKQRLAEYEQEKLVSQFKVELTTKGLKADFADLIPVNDADKAKKAVDFLSGYKAEIEKPYMEKIKALEDQLRNGALKGGVPNATSNNAEVRRDIPKLI